MPAFRSGAGMVDLLLPSGAVPRLDAVALLVRLQVPPSQQGQRPAIKTKTSQECVKPTTTGDHS